MGFTLPDTLCHNESTIYHTLEQLDSLSRGNSPLAYLIREKFDDALDLLYSLNAEALEFPICWDRIYPWANWIAVDENGRAYAYEHKPELDIEPNDKCVQWAFQHKSATLDNIRVRRVKLAEGYNFPDLPFKQLLFVRPGYTEYFHPTLGIYI